jgi:hypothetical protein
METTSFCSLSFTGRGNKLYPIFEPIKKGSLLVSTLSSPKSFIGRHKNLPNSFLGAYAPAFYMLYNFGVSIDVVQCGTLYLNQRLPWQL